MTSLAKLLNVQEELNEAILNIKAIEFKQTNIKFTILQIKSH